MKWLDALKVAAGIDCSEALAVTKKSGPTRSPRNDADALVICKDKVRVGRSNDSCNNDCPKGKR